MRTLAPPTHSHECNFMRMATTTKAAKQTEKKTLNKIDVVVAVVVVGAAFVSAPHFYFIYYICQ